MLFNIRHIFDSVGEPRSTLQPAADRFGLHEITVISRKSKKKIQEFRASGEYMVIDVTSKGRPADSQFSPFHPHGGIPVPGSPGVFSASVEGIWQGLKMFEGKEKNGVKKAVSIDTAKFDVTDMEKLKRTTRTFGTVSAHWYGDVSAPAPERVLTYGQARREIYLPAYHFVLENKLQKELRELVEEATRTKLVLLDFCTRRLDDELGPLSHAWVIVDYINANWERLLAGQ